MTYRTCFPALESDTLIVLPKETPTPKEAPAYTAHDGNEARSLFIHKLDNIRVVEFYIPTDAIPLINFLEVQKKLGMPLINMQIIFHKTEEPVVENLTETLTQLGYKTLLT